MSGRPTPEDLDRRRLLRLGEGLRDPRSCNGLRKLLRLRPSDAHLIVASMTPAVRRLQSATVVDLLGSSFNRRAMPSSVAAMESVRPARLYSRLASEHLEDAIKPGDTGEEELDMLRAALMKARKVAGGRLAASTINRTVSLVRNVVLDYGTATGQPMSVEPRPPGPSKRIGPVRRRLTPTPQDVAALLEHASPKLAAWIGLVAGCGTSPGKAVRLRAGSLKADHDQLVLPDVHRPGLDGRNGWLVVAVPAWVWDLLWRAFPNLDQLPAGTPLFPKRGRPNEPRTIPRRELQRLCERAFGADRAPLTGMDLRRLHQAMAIGFELPRALVRGTGIIERRPGHRPVAHAGQRMTQRLGDGWVELCGPATAMLQHVRRVPRRAPKETGAWEPEQVFSADREREREPLPASVRMQAPAAPPLLEAARRTGDARSAPVLQPAAAAPVRGQAQRVAAARPSAGAADRSRGALDRRTDRKLRADLAELVGELPRIRRELGTMRSAMAANAGRANESAAREDRSVPPAIHAQALQREAQNAFIKGVLVGVGGAKVHEHREEIAALLREALESDADGANGDGIALADLGYWRPIK